ncbi:MAG: dehydrogenase [Rhodospirillaceae bacterium]|nr:dehydrogenase [Rhodospirillaceae bacterium]
MNHPVVALLDPFHPAIVEIIRKMLPDGWELSIATDQTDAARATTLQKADIALVMATKMGAELFGQAPRLRFIQKMGAGVDNIDLDHCRNAAIAVARLGAGNAIQVAEHAMMMILAASRQLVAFDQRVRGGHWDKEAARGVIHHIHGKTVGILGFGAIGRRLARILTGFETTVIYNDLLAAPAELENELGVRRVGFEDLLAASDIISLHVPLTDRTRGMIGPNEFAAMKPNLVLVNCARGGIVDERALTQALRDGRLLGAGLDVFGSEPPGDSQLFTFQNAVFSPHCAGATLNNFSKIAARAIANAEAFLGGRALPLDDIVIDPRALT